MITIKNSFIRHFPGLNTPVLISTLYVFCSMTAHAEDNSSYRQEPIMPIPQSIETDAAKVTLGESLFFDTRLSKDNNIACASCHQLNAGGDDNLAKGLSASSEQNEVHTPSIFNAQFNFRQNWDGSAKTLHQQIDLIVNNPHGFNSSWSQIIEKLEKDNELIRAFNQSYSSSINKKNIIDAIVEFEKTLITPDSKFDRYLRNEGIMLSSEEKQGYDLFKEYGCISCHHGINVGGNLFQKFGVFYNYLAERGNISKVDYGRINITNRQLDTHVFKVPSLRNIAVTAPYLHDGSVATIEEMITIMGKTQLGRQLTDKEVKLIKAFLHTLTGEYKKTPLDKKS